MSVRRLLIFIVAATTAISGCKRSPSVSAATKPAFQNSPLNSVFHIHGQIVDEQGDPLDIGLAYDEGQFISIAKERYRTNLAPTPQGKFDITTTQCASVSLDFGREGYLHEHVTYGSMTDVPDPLRIVMHKIVPTSIPSLPSGNVAGKYITEARYTKPAVQYKSIELELRPDFTLATKMTMPDGKNYAGAGTWKGRDGDNILWKVKWESGTPTPPAQTGDEYRLGITTDGRLIQGYDGPEFTFVAPSMATVPGATAPPNAVGKYLAKGQYMPPNVPYESMELELRSDFTLATMMTLPDGITQYRGAGTWAWPEPKHGNIFITIKWEDGTPLPSKHPVEGDVLDPMDDDIHRLAQHYGGPDFFRDQSTPPPAPANLVGKYLAKSQDQMRLARMPYLSLEVNINPDFTLTAIMRMPDQATTYEGTGTWIRSGPWLIEPSIKWQAGTPPLVRHSNYGPEVWSIMDQGQRMGTDYGTLYRVH